MFKFFKKKKSEESYKINKNKNEEPDAIKNEHKEKYILDKAELEKRLIKLAQTPYTGKVAIGADCYAPMDMLKNEDYICSICHKTTPHSKYYFDPHDINRIREIIKTLKENNYDVLLDDTEFCQYCNKNGKTKDPLVIFKIRFNENDDYHIIKTKSWSSGFELMLAFFTGKDHILGSYDNTITLHSKIDQIHEMIGLGKDIVAKWQKKYKKSDRE